MNSLKTTYKILLIAFCTFLIQYAFAQNNVYLSGFSVEDGLSHSQISAIFQDSKGFLWIGTRDGLNKYDGYEFHVYRHNPLDNNSLANNRIHCIIESKSGKLWIGTGFGLSCFERKSGNFKNFYRSSKNINSISNDNIQALIEDDFGNIWIKTPLKIDKFNPQDKYFTHYDLFDNPFNLTSEQDFYPAVKDMNGIIWIGSKDGLYKMDPNKDILKRYCHDENKVHSISNNEINSIFAHKNILWIGTSYGLDKFHSKKETFEHFYPDKSNPQASINHINQIVDKKNDLLLLGTNNGLIYFNTTEQQFQRSTHIKYLEGSEITSIYKDRSNIFWIGTWNTIDEGLFKLIGNRKRFQTYNSSFDSEFKLNSDDITAIKLNNGFTWVGTNGNGINKIDKEKGSNISIRFSESTNKHYDDFIIDFAPFNKDTIICATKHNVFLMDINSNKFQAASEYYSLSSKALFFNNTITDIEPDIQNNIWISTQKGLYFISLGNVKKIISSKDIQNSIPSNHVNCIRFQNDSILWIGTQKGLARLNTVNKSFTIYKKDIQTAIGLTNNIILSLCIAENNDVWIGTESGLNKYSDRTKSFTYYTQKNGFTNDYIYAILEDNSGNIWVGTNRGISRMEKNTGVVTNYDVKDGVQSYEFNIGACTKSHDGKLFFGGHSGLNSFYPDSIQKNPTVPQIAITSVEKINKSGIHKHYIDDIDKIIISHNDYIFTIEFSALEFSRPNYNNYSYMLEGLDENWINVGNRRYASYAQIPPGAYTFKVKGSNCDLIWNNTGTSVNIIKKPSLFNNIWAYIVYVSFAIFSVIAIIQYRTKNLRQSNQILKEKEIAAREIAFQKEELTIKNKSITDSMTYAQRIITAMMPSAKLLTKHFKDSFILYSPKEIVSGDFYWIAEKGDKIFVAAVDCTGHGIPGAFMSIIGFELLRNIINVKGIEDPSEILHELNNGVADTFRNAEDMTVSDGMDLAFCVVDKRNRVLEYSGAFNPLYIIRDSNVIDYKANRFSVGLADEDSVAVFTKHRVELFPEDVIYIFSDGYADQFGGPKGKKFKYRRFRHLLLTIHKLSFDQQKESLIESFENWKGTLEQVDDILVIGFKLST